MRGTLYGVGLGPGDPELMTLKAVRILREAKIVSYFMKRGNAGHARTIAASVLNGHHEEMPLVYPVTTEFPVGDTRYDEAMHAFYEESAQRIATRLNCGEDIVVIAEGDPFFYGSFMHLYRRLAADYPCQIVPGITGMAGCWTSAKTPMTWGNDVFTVLPGTLDTQALVERLHTTDAAVVMKLGRNLPRVREAMTQAGMLERAVYIEYGTMQAEKVIPLQEKANDDAPYFSMIVVPGQGRRL